MLKLQQMTNLRRHLIKNSVLRLASVNPPHYLLAYWTTAGD